ncbi:MAG TPA: hypothetical protein VJY65_01415 [Chloroflexota bacterium]|nr:hypothetical protein [Chloroflexota bacterium]
MNASRLSRRGRGMSPRLVRILTALGGILGVVMLLPSFIINPGPPPNPTVAQLSAFGHRYEASIHIGAWLQAVSPVLIILFALALVHQAGATTRLAGWMTIVGGTILVMTSLVEVTLYLSAVNGNPATTGLMSLDLIAAVQHLYSMVVAPAVFLPLGAVLLSSHVLPAPFGYAAFVLAGIFAVLGVVALFSPIQPVVNVLASLQGVWWLGAAITCLVRAGTAAKSEPSLERESPAEAPTI